MRKAVEDVSVVGDPPGTEAMTPLPSCTIVLPRRLMALLLCADVKDALLFVLLRLSMDREK